MENFVLNNMVYFDCAMFGIFTLYGLLLVSWFFDTKFWNFFEDLVDEVQWLTVLFGLIFGVWYIGCAIAGWEYRIIPHIIGTVIFGGMFSLFFSVIGWMKLVEIREEVVRKRRRK